MAKSPLPLRTRHLMLGSLSSLFPEMTSRQMANESGSVHDTVLNRSKPCVFGAIPEVLRGKSRQ